MTSELDDLISTSLNLSDENMSYSLNDDKPDEYNDKEQGKINAIEHATNRIMQRRR